MSVDRTINSRYTNAPANMNDGRIFTDYRQNYFVNNLIRMVNNKHDSHDYRLFLTRNAKAMMEANNKYITQKTQIY